MKYLKNFEEYKFVNEEELNESVVGNIKKLVAKIKGDDNAMKILKEEIEKKKDTPEMKDIIGHLKKDPTQDIGIIDQHLPEVIESGKKVEEGIKNIFSNIFNKISKFLPYAGYVSAAYVAVKAVLDNPAILKYEQSTPTSFIIAIGIIAASIIYQTFIHPLVTNNVK
jgi:hypothetical protein